jgi:hypothetical protein
MEKNKNKGTPWLQRTTCMRVLRGSSTQERRLWIWSHKGPESESARRVRCRWQASKQAIAWVPFRARATDASATATGQPLTSQSLGRPNNQTTFTVLLHACVSVSVSPCLHYCCCYCQSLTLAENSAKSISYT